MLQSRDFWLFEARVGSKQMMVGAPRRWMKEVLGIFCNTHYVVHASARNELNMPRRSALSQLQMTAHKRTSREASKSLTQQPQTRRHSQNHQCP